MREIHLKKLSGFKGLTPFDFQKEAYVDCMEFLLDEEREDSGVAVLPTAWGKSLLVSWLALSLFDRGEKCLMVVPQVELLKQNLEKLQSYTSVPVGVYSGSMDSKEFDKPLVIATIGSLKGAEKLFKGFKYIIVDEAHYKFPSKKNSSGEDGVFKAFKKKVKPKKVLGLTATPFTLGSKKGFNVLNMLPKESYAIFKEIVHVTQIKEVIDAGRWSDIKYFNYPYVKEGLILNSTGNDFSEESVEQVNKINDVNNRTCILVKSSLLDKKGLVFVESVKVAFVMRDYLRKYSKKRIEVVCAKTPDKEREEIVREFKRVGSNIACIINVGIFSTGFDCPDLEYIVNSKPTNSLSLYYQIVGRGVRVFEGKEYFEYHDLCGNIDRFGHVEDITVEDFASYGWGCFCGERLITGVPLNIGRCVTKESLRNRKFIQFPKSQMKIEYGKHSGSLVTKLPKYYRDFLLKSSEADTYRDKKREDLLSLLLELEEYELNQLLFV